MAPLPPLEVLVTGFGPFTDVPSNPSFLIVSQLPPSLELSSGRTLRIHIHPTPVRVSYAEVAALIPQLYAQFPNIDFFVHVGVGTSLEEYQLEVLARREPYLRPDVDGRIWDDGNNDNESNENDRPEPQPPAGGSLPAECPTRVDVFDVLEKAYPFPYPYRPGISADAGLYLCEFIYYNSLVMASRLEKSSGKPVKGIFLHVPKGTSPVEIATGRDVLERLLSGMAELEIESHAGSS